MLFASPKVILSLVAILLCVSLSGCSQESPSNVTPTKTTPSTKAAPAESILPEQSSKQSTKAPPLTEEELQLIAADPKDLSPDLRRKRAFALRKKIMQTPDSPAAKQLEELRRAVEAGEIQPGIVQPPQQSQSSDVTPAKEEPQKPSSQQVKNL